MQTRSLAASFGLLSVLSLACIDTLQAQSNEAPGIKLRIAVKPAMPFSFDDKGQLTGYSIDLWKRVAQDAGWTFEVVRKDTVPQVLEAVQKHEADVAVGALSVTKEREEVLDFSHPFYSSGLQIMTKADSRGSRLAIFASVLNMDVLKVVLVLLLALVAMSHVLWLAERRTNPESFPPDYRQGVFESLWWSVSTIITGGCENIAPRGLAGRLVGVLWMLGGIGLTSYITATLASAMTVHTLTTDIKGISDLEGKSVATLDGSSAESYLKSKHMTVHALPDLDAAVAALAAGQVKAIVYDSPMLRYYRVTHPNADLQLAGDLFERQRYGFALPLGSPLRKKINEIVLKLEDEGFVDDLEKKWFAVTQD